jgi:hypothetical protein
MEPAGFTREDAKEEVELGGRVDDHDAGAAASCSSASLSAASFAEMPN